MSVPATQWSVRALACAALVFLSGCGSTQACTEIGCADGVGLDVTSSALEDGERLTAHVCVNGRCTEGEGIVNQGDHQRKGLRVTMPLPATTGDVQLTVRLTRATGEVIAATGTGYESTSHPNGPDCPPECHSVAAELRGTELKSI